MLPTHPVLWHEGMFLGPQHFQQAERHAAATAASALRALRALHHGVLRLELDGRALAGGDVALVAVEGILPDGSPVSALTPDDLPPARPVAEAFAATRTERAGVWLALPLSGDGAVAVSDDGVHQGRHTRFRRRAQSLPDASPGGIDRDVVLAAANLRLLFDHEARDGHTALRVAEIVRAPAGGFAIAEDFAPPCLRLGASGVLAGTVRRIAEILVARSSEMAAHRRSRTQGLVEFSVSELANFLMLLTVNGHLPRLLNQLHSGSAHPEDVYLGLATLAGQLMTLADEGHPKDLPALRARPPGRCLRGHRRTPAPAAASGHPDALHPDPGAAGERARPCRRHSRAGDRRREDLPVGGVEPGG